MLHDFVNQQRVRKGAVACQSYNDVRRMQSRRSHKTRQHIVKVATINQHTQVSAK
jgi:hypothetical protein